MNISAKNKEEFSEIEEALKPYESLTANFETVKRPFSLLQCEMKAFYEDKFIVFVPCEPISSIEVGPELYRYFSPNITIFGTKTKEQQISFQIREMEK